MKEKSQLIEKIRKSALMIILLLISTASLTLAIVNYLAYSSGTGFFIFTIITAAAIEGLHSTMIYKKGAIGRSPSGKFLIVCRIIWNYTMLISAAVIWYKVRFSKPIVQDKSYWIYNLMVLYIIISFIIKYILNFLKERKRIIEEEEAGFTSIFLKALATVGIILYINSFVFYWLYIPKKTIDLSNAPRPSSLYIYEYKLNEVHSFSFSSKEIKIEDDYLLESFINNLSKTKIENMSGVEYLCYDMRSKNEPYYMLNLMYKGSNGNAIESPYVFGRIYFLTMRLYKNGELVLQKYRSNRNILSYFYTTELYKVTLSQELTNQIIELFETNRQVKDSPSL